MTTYRVEQRQIVYRGRMFHFVSYEGQQAKPSRGLEATPPMWFLMNAGTRWEVMPQLVGQELAELDQCLLAWLKQTLG